MAASGHVNNPVVVDADCVQPEPQAEVNSAEKNMAIQH